LKRQLKKSSFLETKWRYQRRVERAHDKTQEILRSSQTNQKAESRVAQIPKGESDPIKEKSTFGKSSGSRESRKY
jgi:hypothetical protein